jgi:hypothetical protein
MGRKVVRNDAQGRDGMTERVIMHYKKAETTDCLCRSYAEQWLAIWQCAAIWGRANLEGLARLWGLRSPRSDSLAALSPAMDRQMRNPAFINLMRHGFQVMSVPNSLRITRSLLPEQSPAVSAKEDFVNDVCD